VDRRKEPRIQIDQEVTVTVLGEENSPPFEAIAVDMSGNGMRILSPRPVPYQAAVKVQEGDLLLLGEVVRVEALDCGYMFALKLQHSLQALSDLQRLNQALQWEDRREVDERGAKEVFVREPVARRS
jgi:PilZ domain-containing protein